MTSFLAILVVAIIGGLIQRARRSDHDRWRYTRMWMLVVSFFIVIVGAHVTVSRGWSKSSLAIVGSGFLLIGSAFCLLFDRRIPEPRPSQDDWFGIELRPTECSPNRRLLCVAWGVLTLLFLTSALRYGGAFVREPTLEKISTVAALGEFAPLHERRPVGVGQCLEARVVGADNKVGACSLSHRSEIADQVDEGKSCQSEAYYGETGLDLKVLTAGPFDGSLYCVLQSRSPTLTWTRRISKLAATP